MDLLSNEYIIDNLAKVFLAVLISFLITFFLVPLVGRFAKLIGALDLPAKFVRGERGVKTRIQSKVTPKLGGIAMLVGILAGLYLVNAILNQSYEIPRGILLGLVIVSFTGFLDDKFYFGGSVQLLGQAAAAMAIVLSGISISSISFLGTTIDFNLLDAQVDLAGMSYLFMFPADIITILWIVGLINAVNWVGGVDGLNGTVTSVIAFTLLIFTLSLGNIPVAILISLHLGAVLGVLPFNYPPSKIFYGSGGDFMNGYLLASFAILGGTRWTTTLVILSIPIIDAFLVMLIRLRLHPEARKNPLKLLQISDTNHLHHRLLQSGYDVKTVILIEASIVSVVSAIAIMFGDIRREVAAFLVVAVILFTFFSFIFFLRNRRRRGEQLDLKLDKTEKNKKKSPAQVRVIVEDEGKEGEDYERFVY